MIGSVFRAMVVFEVVTQTSTFCLIFFPYSGYTFGKGMPSHFPLDKQFSADCFAREVAI